MDQINNICAKLTSNKITERRKCCEEFTDYISEAHVINFLKTNPKYWNLILDSIKTCLEKDADKFVEERRKKATVGKATRISGDVFLDFVKLVCRHSDKFPFDEIVGYILGCLKIDKMKYCHETSYLATLKEAILLNSKIRGLLENDKWIVLYDAIKALCEENLLTSETDLLRLKCFGLIIKWGPLSGFPLSHLKQEFSFITRMCDTVKLISLPREQREDLIDIIFEFCKHTAKDCRIACCKFGEDTMTFVTDFYEVNCTDIKINSKLIDYFLLQLTMHNPKGVVEGDKNSYACNWDNWKKCLRRIFSLLNNEIHSYVESSNLKSLFYSNKRNSIVKQDNFVDLFVEISRQLFAYKRVDVSFSVNSSHVNEGPTKRKRIDISWKTYIYYIEESKSWLWIKLVQHFLKSYPSLLDADDFLNLLQVLTAIQIECKDNDVLDAIYDCLCTLEEIELENGDSDVEKQWKIIGESTVSAIGLNHNITTIQKLLRQLINNRNVIDLDQVLQMYLRNIVTVTIDGIRTLDCLVHKLNISKTENQTKIIIDYILNENSLKKFNWLSEEETAKLLISLILRQSPNDLCKNEERIRTNFQQFLKEMCEIYSISGLEDSLVKTSNKNSITCVNNEKKISYYVDLGNYLENRIESFIEISNQLEVRLNIILFLIHITNYLVYYDIVKIENVSDLVYMKLVEQQLHREEIIQEICQFGSCEERKLKEMTDCIMVIYKIFSFNQNGLAREIRRITSNDFLMSLFGLLNFLQDNSTKKRISTSQFQDNLRMWTTKALAHFAYITADTDKGLMENQVQILEVLIGAEYNCDDDGDYALLLTPLKYLKLCKVGILPDKIVEILVNSVQIVCEARHQRYECVLDILPIIYDLLPHVLNSNINKQSAINLLYPFYLKRSGYGPKVSVLFLQCINQLSQHDPDNRYSFWFDGEQIVEYVPLFFDSDSQEVRFEAIKTLVTYFEEQSKSGQLQNFHKQEIIFSKICEISLQMVESDEQNIDEINNRTACVLQNFASVLISCPVWVEETLLALMKLVQCKQLDSIDKILTIISRQFGFKNNHEFLFKYLEIVIEKWLEQGMQFNDIPFTMFGCIDKENFYENYPEIAITIAVTHNLTDLQSITLKLKEKKQFENVAPKIFVNCLRTNVENLQNYKISNSFKFLCENVGNLEQILSEQIEKILVYLIQFVTDNKMIYEKFDVAVIFLTKYMNFEEFRCCMELIQNFLCGGKDIISFLSNKFETVLLQLRLNIDNFVSLEEKLKYFHHYTIYCDLIIDKLPKNRNWEMFFIRQATHSLLFLIENNLNCPKFSSAVSKYFLQFLKRVLPQFCDTIKLFLPTICNILTNASTIDQRNLEILNYLIVDNTEILRDSIKNLEDFPQISEFEEIRKVHHRIKYENVEISVETEIRFFLSINGLISNNNRYDSLKRLKTILRNRKHEVLELALKLEDLRGFSEDCEKSLLHQLICGLVKLGVSSNEQVSFEALGCLGELGPTNLMTLVLQPEKEIENLNCSPFELITGHVVSLLTKYLVDPNTNVIETSSKTLHIILNTKEGRKIADSQIDFGYGAIEKHYLFPFICKGIKTSKVANYSINVRNFVKEIDVNQLWMPHDEVTHENWIVNLVCSLLLTFNPLCYLGKLVDISKIKPSFCEQVLPVLINLIISLQDSTLSKVISSKINYFFESHWILTAKDADGIQNEAIAVNKKSVQCMLDVVKFVRLQQSFIKSKSQKTDLELDYLKVGKASEFCGGHFTAIMYAELWCQRKMDGYDNKLLNDCTILDVIYEEEGEGIGLTLHNIFRNGYKAIGDLDALSGCGTSFQLNDQLRIEHYKDTGRWDQVLHYYDQEISKNDLHTCLKQCALYQLPVLLKDEVATPLDETQYECFWRLSQWTMNEQPNQETNINFEKYHYYTLKALHENDEYTFEEVKNSAALCIVENLRQTSLESCKNIYPILTKLQSLNELNDFQAAIKLNNFDEICNKFKQHNILIKKNNFEYIEPILTQRIVMLKDYLQNHDEHNETLKGFFVETILDLSDLARIEGQFQVGAKALSILQNMVELSDNGKIEVQLRDAQFCWAVNDKSTARRILSKLCKNEEIDLRLRSAALKLSGQWMVETNSENRLTIIKNYFLNSLQLDKAAGYVDMKNTADTYDKLASFSDKEYQQIFSHTKSDLFQRKNTNMEKSKRTAESIARQNSKTIEERKAAAFYLKQSKIDEDEIENTWNELNNFLYLALKYYVLNLQKSDENNIRLFRVMSLLLENRRNNSISDIFKTYLPRISTYKYLNLLPQLVPHIGDTDLFGEQIKMIVEKCATEHPHHTLPLILSLANSNKDKKSSDTATKTSINDNRIATAVKLLDKLKNNVQLVHLIKELQEVSEALIELAYIETPTGNERKSEFKLPRSAKILQIKNYNEVLVPTYSLPVKKNKIYENIVGIHSFGESYQTVGGINAPKRIICRGNDGIERSQLVKGHDDLRQDAVMQQVFTMMNNLLSANKQTRNLLIRTYKIVPLSMRSGILEWVDNSMPIGEYLLNAHSTYRPNDMALGRCRAMFKDADSKDKLKIYQHICKHFHPIFHKFFESSFPNPNIWYERRRAYVHSVATTSMCGYILGIGDRHVNNILIDKNTAEVIHIDFGIAFEQGRVLPTPETVPFRLTREIVDGMGVSGVEGIFRRSCEKTMLVLRQNSLTILTILEVLLYDPLYAWTVSPAEANKRQNDEEEQSNDIRKLLAFSDEENQSVNNTAERALLRLRDRLQGTEEGNQTSIEHQVGNLIQQAVDPANLCRLFYGWQPYL